MNENDDQKGVEENEQQPTLYLFRATPSEMMKHPPLASSLQALETCFFLIGLGRFPSALVMCATSWESAINAKLGLGAENQLPLYALIDQIQNFSGNLRSFDRGKLHAFRDTRNRIVHYGFSPKDDEECACLLVETGLPFLNCCYRDLFDFCLDWRDIRPGNEDFHALASDEMDKAGLLPEVAEQLRVVSRVYSRAKQLRGLKSRRYCFRGFANYIMTRMKEASLTTTEARILQHSEEGGEKFAHEEEQKAEVARIFEFQTWEFDCPTCAGCNSIVAELDDAHLQKKQVSVRRCICVRCGLVVPNENPFLADELLREKIKDETPRILKELGIH